MSKHSYQPLTSREFRILTLLPGAESTPIKTTLRHVSLEDKLSFDALSYEWGPESSNISQIYVGDEPFTIRHNLWLFLTRLRASSHSAQQIYVDAICINQKDGEEKSHQVALMSEIYMRAKKVLVWLGEHDRSSEMVFGTKFEDYVSNMPKGVRAIPFLLPVTVPLHIIGRAKQASRAFRSSTERVAAWTSLLSRSYWNRTWIIQEFLLARSIVVFCGPDHMSGDLIFNKPFQDHFFRMMRKNKGGLDGIPRSFLLYFWKLNQKHHGVFGRGKPYFAGVDIFELAFNFQYTECQTVLDHIFGLLALEDQPKGPRIIPNYNISVQNLFIHICMLKLPMAAGSIHKVTDDGVVRVAMLFRGLRLTFDDAEKILDILLENTQSKTENNVVIATIAKAFDQFGLLKPERKEWILQQTKASPTAEQIISATRQWQIRQKRRGNWYSIHQTAQVHEPPGMGYLQLDEPLWSHYSTLRDTAARSTASAANAQNVNNMNNMVNMNNLNLNMMNLNTMTMNNMAMNNAAMMAPGGAGFTG